MVGGTTSISRNRMLAIAMELARDDSTYEDVASKFWEHFLYIAAAMNNLGQDGVSLWDEADSFYYDVLHEENGDQFPLKVRSMVGLIPLFAVETLEPEVLDKLPGFKKRLEWFIDNRPDLTVHTACMRTPGSEERRLLSIVNLDRLRQVLEVMAKFRNVYASGRYPVIHFTNASRASVPASALHKGCENVNSGSS